MTSAFSCCNSVSLCLASFSTPKPNLLATCLLQVSLPAFAFQSHMMKRISVFGVSLAGLVGLHRTIQLQLLWH